MREYRSPGSVRGVRVTDIPTVTSAKQAWRFLRGERPRLIRSNQPPVPSVAYPAEAERR